MRLVGTLEDEEDAHIKKRLKEEKEEEAKAEEATAAVGVKEAGAGGRGGVVEGGNDGGGSGEKTIETLQNAARGNGGSVKSRGGANGSEKEEKVGILSPEPIESSAARAAASGPGGSAGDATESEGASRVGGGALATVGEEGGRSAALANGIGNGIANGVKEAAKAPGRGGLLFEAGSIAKGGGGGGGRWPSVGNAASGALAEACGDGSSCGNGDGDGPVDGLPCSGGGVDKGATAAKNACTFIKAEGVGEGTEGAAAAKLPGASGSGAGKCDAKGLMDGSNGDGSPTAAPPLRVAMAGSTEAARAADVDSGTRKGKGTGEEALLSAGGGNGAPREKRVGSSAGGGKRGRGVSCDSEVETSTDDGETTDAGDHDDDDVVDGSRADGCAVDAAPLSLPHPPPPLPPPTPTGLSTEASAGGRIGATEQQKQEEGEEGGEGEEEDTKQGTGMDAVSVTPPPRPLPLPPPTLPKRAAITEVFGGVMCSVVTCSRCGGRSFSTEPTICLSLEIPLKKSPLSERAQAYLAKNRVRAAGAPAGTAAAVIAATGAGATATAAKAAGTTTATGATTTASGVIVKSSSASASTSLGTSGADGGGSGLDPKTLPAAPQTLLPGFQIPVSSKQRRKVRAGPSPLRENEVGVGGSMKSFFGKAR